MAMNEQGDVINLDCLFETELSKPLEQGKLPEDIKLPEGFEVCVYPESVDGRLVLTDGNMYIVGRLRIVSRKVDANFPVTIGILPFDDPSFSEVMKYQLDKKAKHDAWIRRTPDADARQAEDDALIGRKEDARDLRREGRSMDERAFVWPGGTHWWSDESSGVTWLGLHGINSICVVTKSGELDVTRVRRCFKDVTVENFRKTVTSEIEDLASPYSTFFKMFGQSILKPFGVVSLALGSTDAHEESVRMEYSDKDGVEKKKWEKRKKYLPKVPGYDEKKTMKYLREQMRKVKTCTNDETAKASGTNYGTAAATSYLQKKMKMMKLEGFTVDETIKTAISAFQYLLKKELESHEIGVCVMVMKAGYVITDKEKFHAKDLGMTDIQYYLAAINEPGSLERRFRPLVM